MLYGRIRGLAILSLACLSLQLPLSVYATQITATFQSLGGTNWQAQYSILNNSLPKLEEFSIFFAVETSASIAVDVQPAGWDFLVLQPDTGIPADGLVDGLALGAGLALGDSIGVLRTTFTSLVTNPVSQQRFEIRDPMTFQLLDSGLTSVTAVPEAPAWLLWLAGSFALALTGGKRRLSAQR